MHVIAIANRKGGVGKSSVASNLAAALALGGRRVLVIDMDSQASATAILLDELPRDAGTTTHVLLGERSLAEVVRPSHREQLWLAPAAGDLTRAQLAIVGRTGRDTILRRALRDMEREADPRRQPGAADSSGATIDGFDVIVIDTAPEQQLATVNSLVAASHVLMPFTPDPKALEGLATTSDAVAEIVDAELAQVALLGCVQVGYDRRLAVTRQAREQVRSAYGDLLLETCIRANSGFIVCPAWHRDILAMEQTERAPRRGTEDFLALANEVACRLDLPVASRVAA